MDWRYAGHRCCVANALEANDGECFIGGSLENGSLASSLQGNPRATNDIDFVISLPLGRVQSFRDRLGEDFELDPECCATHCSAHARPTRSTCLP